jgi:anti-sigma factor RsiW
MFAGGTTCRGAGKFLLDFVEGRLDEKTARRFQEHIDMCPNCRRYLEQYLRTIKLVKELPEPSIPPELEESTCQFLLDAVRNRADGN